ncbi:MAG: hypothetical protein K8T25_12035, partial [Planctomycetia bacterium]|nr:hypothetical protein [Planctomycetia bacterium]
MPQPSFLSRDWLNLPSSNHSRCKTRLRFPALGRIKGIHQRNHPAVSLRGQRNLDVAEVVLARLERHLKQAEVPLG